MTLPHWRCLTCLGSVRVLEQYKHLLILCFLPKVTSSFLFLRTKKWNKIIGSSIFSFFLLLSVIKDFQFSSPKPLFIAMQNCRQSSVLTWAPMTCVPPPPSPPSLPARWLLRQWSLLISPAGIQLFGIQSSALPAPKHAGALSLADSHRATTTAAPRLPALRAAGVSGYGVSEWQVRLQAGIQGDRELDSGLLTG